MRSAEQQRAFEEKLASTAINAVSPLQRRTVSEVKDPTVMGGSARPADFIAPYYGDKFGREVAKAMLYNARRPLPFLQPDSYSRLYDTIQFERDRRVPRPALYYPREHKVQLGNQEAERIDSYNAENLAKAYSNKSTSSIMRDLAHDTARRNSLVTPQELVALSEISPAEHEFTHHATAPDKGITNYLSFESTLSDIRRTEGSKYGGIQDYNSYHTADPAELTQGAARFQRELFAKTGRRIEKPEDFEDIVYSDSNMEFMTPEARRYLVFARRLAKDPTPEGKARAEESRKAAVRKLAELLPATVSADDSFESRINERISGLMG